MGILLGVLLGVSLGVLLGVLHVGVSESSHWLCPQHSHHGRVVDSVDKQNQVRM